MAPSPVNLFPEGPLGGLFLLANNKVALVLIVLIPTIALLAYISMVVHTVQPRKKSIPRRASRNVKVVR